MKTRLPVAILVPMVAIAPAFAHRLDEYLEATILSVEKSRVQAFMRLIPGIAVSKVVLATIDTNRDGVLSEGEQRAYAELVLRHLSLTVDGRRLTLQLGLAQYPRITDMQAGSGEIHIEFSADLPAGGTNRKLIYENHHESRIAAYLVNCLVSRDKNIQILAQHRNENQSFYELDFAQTRPSDGISGDH